MRSVRLPAELEARIDRAAAREGVSRSVFIRQALAQSCDARLSANLRDRLGDVIGTISSGKLRARDSRRVFMEIVARKHNARRTR